MSSLSNHKTQKNGIKKQKTRKVVPRGQANLFGFHAVEEAWRNPNRKINRLFVTQNAWKTLSEKLTNVTLNRPEPEFLTRDELDKILPGQVHQGIAVDTDPLPEMFLQDIIIQNKKADKSLILMLDQVTDPHNVGAISRSACAFGACAIIQQRRHAPTPEGVLAKTASGALEHLPMIEETNLSEAIEELQAAGYTALALDETGEDLKSALTAKADKVVLVLGAEGKGLRPKIKQTCDKLVRIPANGPVGSLNVSNAAASALYALAP